ncbi:placenta-specific gene 8 protein-like [Physella acuta]|uniref:placenta-specific gene 8 protein-like n=1 Tax=Physella acuta TaxID=109671 RepID=UPI0027DB23DD|nr:placenta-specific gene 8 protein-like [Physella acuta]
MDYDIQQPTVVQQPTATQQTTSMNTIHIQTTPAFAPVKPPRNWSSGICSCCDDCGICLCGTFCHCCLQSQNAADLGESCCLFCCVPGAGTALRVKLRMQENITGSICNDCLLETFCAQCSTCQLARELKIVRQYRTMSSGMTDQGAVTVSINSYDQQTMQY